MVSDTRHEEELAGGAPALEVLERSARVLERVARADSHVQAAVGDEREELRRALAQQLGRTRVGLQRGALDVERAGARERLQLERLGLPARRAVEDHPARRPQRLQAL